MKTFILRSVLFFIIAIIITVAVFFYVNGFSVTNISVTNQTIDSTETIKTQTTEQAGVVTQKIKEKIPEGGVPLSSLPLTESHKKAFTAVNINVDTFVLTEAMIACAGAKIGDDRIVAIIDGSAPSVLEITKLIPCLGA